MRNLKMKLEKETKTRINIIGSTNSSRKEFWDLIVKPRIIFESNSIDLNTPVTFPTEILCSSFENNNIIFYLELKEESKLLLELKDNILKSLHETYSNMELSIINDKLEFQSIQEKFIDNFSKIINKYYGRSLNEFYEVDNVVNEIIEEIKFNELLKELINFNSSDEITEGLDDYIWNKYFNELEISFKSKYNKWFQVISRYYVHNDEGHVYINEQQVNANVFINKDFENLCKALYGNKNSCSLMIDRVYMEVPSSKEQFSGIVFVDYIQNTQCNDLIKLLESRVSQDCKETFMFIVEANRDINRLSVLNDKIDNSVLNDRIFCTINQGYCYKDEIISDKKILVNNDYENLIDELKCNVSKKINISKEKIAVIMQLDDIHSSLFEKLDINSDFIKLIKFIRKESEKNRKTIKIKSNGKENVINISLNQERMSVQALVSILYERYNGYLMDVWNRIIKSKDSIGNNEYCYSKSNSIIRSRKDSYQGFKSFILRDGVNDTDLIDFSLRSGDNKDSKRILKMLLNYGYNTVGFNTSENKIIVNVNGEISIEDKEKLLESIKERLEESAVSYFENSFLIEVTGNKFNTNSVYSALEIEKSITIDDFYRAIKDTFKKISDNILRYEVILQAK